MRSDGFPEFIGIGAAKSGTTWLAVNLNRHPEIFMPPRKEVNSFDYLEFDSNCIRQYVQHFRDAGNAKLRGEISTIYLQSERAPPRIRQLVPEVKLIVSLRNPIEQIYSHYWHLRRQNFHETNGNASPPSVEHALDRYPELLIEPARYYTHLCRWREYFPKRQILVIFFDDIVASPESVLEGIWSFLGVSCPDGHGSARVGPGVRERQGVSPRTKNLERLHGELYALLVRHVYNPMKRVLGPRRAAALKERFRVREVMERAFFRPGYPAMSTELRGALRERLGGEIDSLAGMLGRDLSHWR